MKIFLKSHPRRPAIFIIGRITHPLAILNYQIGFGCLWRTVRAFYCYFLNKCCPAGKIRAEAGGVGGVERALGSCSWPALSVCWAASYMKWDVLGDATEHQTGATGAGAAAEGSHQPRRVWPVPPGRDMEGHVLAGAAQGHQGHGFAAAGGRSRSTRDLWACLSPLSRYFHSGPCTR